MRGADETSGSLFSYVDIEARIPARHPLRQIRRVVKRAIEAVAIVAPSARVTMVTVRALCEPAPALASLDAAFEKSYAPFGPALDPAGTADPGEPVAGPVAGPRYA